MFENLNALDWVVLGIIGVSSLISLWRGFFKEAFSLVVWLLAIVLTVMFYEQLAVVLEPYIESPSLRQITALISLFIICLLVGGLFNFIMGQLVVATGLSGTDKMLGMVFGALRGVLIVVALIVGGKTYLPLEQEKLWKASVVLPHFERIETWTVKQSLAFRDFILPLFDQ